MRGDALMRPMMSVVTAVLILAACGSGSSTESTPRADVADAPDGVVAVEVLYLSHLPQMDSVLAQIDALLAEYESVAVARYDVATAEGQAFAEAKALAEHPFLSVLVDGRMEFDLDGRAISLNSFPQGQGTADVPDGPWSLDDLRSILDAATAG